MSKLPAILKGKKGSETFLDYAGPFLMPFLKDKDNATNERLEMALRIPWMIWNASVMADRPGNTVDYLGSIRLLIKNQPPEAKQWIKMLKERKKLLFSQYNYLFGEFKFRFDDNTGEFRGSVGFLVDRIMRKFRTPVDPKIIAEKASRF